MVTAEALYHGDPDRLLAFDSSEHPVALQLGGSDPTLMASAAELGQARGYDEININVGCPSDRVQSGKFGACLMASPDVVVSCLRSMMSSVDIPVTVKTRIGIDDHDDYSFLRRFVESVADAGCARFVIHARKAILAGLSPKENRSVPELNYPRVYQLKKEFPQLEIVLNGGVTTVDQVREHLQHVDAVMIGRQAYNRPWFLVELGSALGASILPQARQDIVETMLPYIEQELLLGTQLKHITRHMLGLFAGEPGARAWRRFLSENAHRPGAGIEIVTRALERLPLAA
jgi:tRNA-dihydrouridine synthase A